MNVEARHLVKDLRRETGASQAELARRLSTTQSAVARLEAGGSNPRIETLERVAEALGHELLLAVRPLRSSVDETLIATNLRSEPDVRLARFASAYRSVRPIASAARTQRAAS